MDSELEAARFHLERGRVLLEEQRARVARFRALGERRITSELLLRQMEDTVLSFERHLALVESEAAPRHL